jgi:hypothetical protein
MLWFGSGQSMQSETRTNRPDLFFLFSFPPLRRKLTFLSCSTAPDGSPAIIGIQNHQTKEDYLPDGFDSYCLHFGLKCSEGIPLRQNPGLI